MENIENKKILVVEKDELTRQMIAQMIAAELNRLGFGSVLTAGSGSEAIMSAKENKPDIITTSLRLPDSDGVELMKELRKLEPLPKVIIITGTVSAEAWKLINSAKPDGILKKPFTRDQLAEAINKVV